MLVGSDETALVYLNPSCIEAKIVRVGNLPRWPAEYVEPTMLDGCFVTVEAYAHCKCPRDATSMHVASV